MRYKANENTKVFELIKEIKSTESSHVFHLDNNIKICLTLFRKCEICKKFYKNSDMETKKICWECFENGKRISEEPDYKRVDY